MGDPAGELIKDGENAETTEQSSSQENAGEVSGGADQETSTESTETESTGDNGGTTEVSE